MTTHFEREGPVALLTTDRPEARNALDFETGDELLRAWGEFRDDRELRVAILTGAGEKAFCAGADLRAVAQFYRSLTPVERLRRSELAVPAANPKMIKKSAASDADLVFLDLEDATAPALKEEARKNAIEGLKTLEWGRTLRAVRVNSADTRWAADDLIEVVTNAHEHLDIIIIPKPYAPRDIWFFETLLDQLEQKLGIEPKIRFEALIEESKALACVEEIAACSPRLDALILGFGDLAASLGFRMGHEARPEDHYPGDPWHAARARMIAACRANGKEVPAV